MKGSWRQRWRALYHRSSIQYILSLSFTAVAVVGMALMGLALFLRFSASSNAQAEESSQQVLAQVNRNMDNYLRAMMRVSNTVYYQVIKDLDLATEEDLESSLDLLYENNRDSLVSIAVFSQEGQLIAAAPLAGLKASVFPHRETWFTTAMDQIENLHFSTPHVQNLFEDPDHRYRWVVSLSRQVELTRKGSIESGVLLVDMNFSGIEQICKDVTLPGLSVPDRRQRRADLSPPPAAHLRRAPGGEQSLRRELCRRHPYGDLPGPAPVCHGQDRGLHRLEAGGRGAPGQHAG